MESNQGPHEIIVIFHMEVHGKLKYLKEHQEIMILVRAVISVSEPRVERTCFLSIDSCHLKHFGPPSYGGSCKITVICPSVRLSVRPSIRPSFSSAFLAGMGH